MNDEAVQYGDYKIFHPGNGFQQTLLFGTSMYRMTGFIAVRDNIEAYEFFFGLSTIESALHGAHLSSDGLVEEALQVIKSRLDEGRLIDGTQYAYQYDFEVIPLQFKLVDKPVWMTQSPR